MDARPKLHRLSNIDIANRNFWNGFIRSKGKNLVILNANNITNNNHYQQTIQKNSIFEDAVYR